MIANTLPRSLIDNPRLDRWIGFEQDRTVGVRTGKVEIGQGIVTALMQIAADELDVPPDRVRMISGETEQSPNEWYTAGSLSIEVSGTSIRLVCAEVRRMFVERAAAVLGCDAAELAIADGRIMRSGRETQLDYWSLSGDIDLSRAVTGAAAPKRPGEFQYIGRSVARLDLPAKVTGAAFVHDLAPAGLMHARVVRHAARGAKLVTLDEAGLAAALGDRIRIVRDGSFVAVAGDDETVVARAVEVVPRHATWDAGPAIPPNAGEPDDLMAAPSRDREIGDGKPATAARPGRTVEATYSRPYIAHASMAPSCALACFDAGRLTVWTHSQGVFQLQAALSQVLKLGGDRITVHHRHGAGCYGHNGADDVALDAAVVAMRFPGRTIRVQWSREDELRHAPFGSAMTVRMRAALDASGRPLEWTHEVWSGPHGQRPGLTGGAAMLAARELPDAQPLPEPNDVPDAAGGGATRNATAPYDLPGQRIIHHLLTRLPVRTSSLRTLGGFVNVFAAECFIDELADIAGEDPVAYRLALLSDPRARRVIEVAAEMAGWPGRGERGAGRGKGLGFARYKNRGGYCAVVAEVEVDRAVRLVRIWSAVDAGLVINPDGATNQIEGGIVQAASWTLKEAVRFDGGVVSSTTWETYPILRFSEVPPVEIRIIAAPDEPPLGLGEVGHGPTAAAIGNAVAHALGVRIRALPLDRDRIMSALLASPEGAPR